VLRSELVGDGGKNLSCPCFQLTTRTYQHRAQVCALPLLIVNTNSAQTLNGSPPCGLCQTGSAVHSQSGHYCGGLPCRSVLLFCSNPVVIETMLTSNILSLTARLNSSWPAPLAFLKDFYDCGICRRHIGGAMSKPGQMTKSSDVDLQACPR